MLDLKFVRENPEVVKQNIKNKFQDKKLPLVDEVIELDAQARATQTEADVHCIMATTMILLENHFLSPILKLFYH